MTRPPSRILSKLVAIPAAAVLVLVMGQAAAAQPPAQQPAEPAATAGLHPVAELPESDTGLYVVQFEDPALAAYTGGIPGLAPTSPRATGADRLDVDAPASTAYLAHLSEVQEDFAAQMEQVLAREVAVEYQYLNVLNGMGVSVDAAEAGQLATLPGVAAVYPDRERELDTDTSHELIGSAGFWDGETGPGLATRGEGIVVGMLDTGVNGAHPSFATVDGAGFVHSNPLGEGNYLGVCDPDHPAHEDVCTEKLIGAYNFHPEPAHGPSVQDWHDHGSHVGATIAGNVHEATFTVGQDTYTRTVQGVAPRANVVSYLVCSELCPSTASVAAVNQAIEDEIVDVLNYSISGTDDPWNDPVDLAFLDAYEAGIYVSASAGNDGPGASTVAKTGPWNAAVAASTHQRVIAHTVDAVGPGAPPELAGLPGFPGDGPQVTADITAELRAAGDNLLGCEPFSDDVFAGAIALVERGDCAFALKVDNAHEAGAIAVVIGNNVAGPPTAPGGLGPADGDVQIPALMVGQEAGAALLAFAAEQADAQLRINAATDVFIDPEWEDIVAGFSSRGPSRFDMLAPTFTAPGVNILAAGREVAAGPDNYAVMGGTSMSSPHAAGAAALLLALHPEWSQSEVRSALAGTADPEVLRKEDGVTPADAFDQGSGRLDLGAAARVGLVMDETHANFLAADPGLDGDPRTLNVPHLVDQNCVDSCTWTRTLTSVADTPVEYTVAVTDPPGGTASASLSPSSTVDPGEQVTLEVTVTAPDLSVGEWRFADVRLETSGNHSNGQPVAPVHYPAAVSLQPPTLDLDPEEIAASQHPDEVTTATLTVGNAGGEPLEWNLTELTPAPAAPQAAPLQDGELGTITLWDQPPSGTSGMISDFYTELDAGVYSADDFQAAGDVEIELIHTDGFVNVGDLAEMEAINWFIYPDAGGVPAGHPEEEGPGSHVWTLRAAPDADGVSVADDNVTLDVPAATGESLALGAGTYWLTVFPEIDDPACCPGDTRWNWIQAEQRQAEAHLIDPAAIGGPGAEDWVPYGPDGLSLPFTGVAFRLEGTIDCTPGDIPWLEVDPTAGEVAPLSSDEVTVTLDSTGLAPGEYHGSLCLITNDPSGQATVIPVTLQVEELVEEPEIDVAPAELTVEVPAGSATTETLTVGNTGTAALEWEIDTAAPASGPSEAPADEPGSGLAAAADSLSNLLGALAPAAGHELAGAAEAEVPEPAAAAAGPAAAAPAQDPPPPPPDAVTLTHSESPDLLVDHSIACTDQNVGGTVDNGYLREFALPEFGIEGGFEVAEVSFGVQVLSLAAPVQVNLYTMVDPAGSVTYGNLQQIGTTEVVLESQELTEVTVPVTGAALPGDTLVVEVEPPDLGGIGVFFIGANDHGQTGPSYLRSASCGAPEPTDLALLGFPEIHMVLNVTGTEVEPPACATPADVPWLSADPDHGTTAPGETSAVTVGIDAADLTPGDHSALLCVASNDPQVPLVEVPVSVTVTEAGPACDRTIHGTHPGPLTVSEGVTCLAAGAFVLGPVTVAEGAGLVSTAAVVQGPVAASGAEVVDLSFSQVTGPISVAGSSEVVSLLGNTVIGPVSLVNNHTGDTPIVVSGNTVIGPLSCSGNQPAPTHQGLPNTVVATQAGQCADL